MTEENKQDQESPATRHGGTDRRSRHRRGEVERTPRPISSGVNPVSKPGGCGCGK